jgi:glycosyltransferase involved in cell wall biosynthesis
MEPAMGQLIGILPTYRRPAILADTLVALSKQRRRIDRLIVVDNERNPETEAIVLSAAEVDGSVGYLPAPENLGFAGGVGFGMRHVLTWANDDDWIVLLDDDDPPRSDDALAVLEEFARERLGADERTAAVGISGGWFDWRRGTMRRVPDDELLGGAVEVDHVAGNQLPMFLVRVVREVGPFCEELFFGLSELEFGLRLWSAGYKLWGYGPLWRKNREMTGRLDHELRPSRRLPEMEWRRYYTLRNVIFILRRFGHRGTAVRVSLVNGLGKPIANLVVTPRLAVRHLVVNARAIRDGWTGRMGRRVEPDGSRRPVKAEVRASTS